MNIDIHDVGRIRIVHYRVNASEGDSFPMTRIIIESTESDGHETVTIVKLFTKGEAREVYHHEDYIINFERGSHDNEKEFDEIRKKIASFKVGNSDRTEDEDTKAIGEDDEEKAPF